MELQKHPETEQGYWEAIEALGAECHFLARTQNRIAAYAAREGRAADTDFWLTVSKIAELSTQLAEELSAKFGIILPKDCPKPDTDGHYPEPPEGKRWYWPWYHAKREAWLRGEFDKLICSACPLAEFDLSFASRIPCKPFPGSLYQLRAPHICAMTEGDHSPWTSAQLMANIFEASGEDGLLRFLEKRRALIPA